MNLAAQASAFLVDYLRLLNAKTPPPEEELTESLELLPEIDHSLETLRASINEQIDAGDTGPFTLKLVPPSPAKKKASPSRKKKAAEHSYILKISLEKTTPPIWRTIRVPSSLTLADLHTTIQSAMGWDDYHPHIFIIDGKHYGLPVDGDADEAAASLADLRLTEKKKFLYIYDFGDDWVHLVTVEKKLSLAETGGSGDAAAVCLAGARACPPEDCGGPPGYEELLLALKTPRKKKSREILDWAGNFDPEAFDLEEANLRILSSRTPDLPSGKK
jgi:hypothetical protein